ncbi:TPA: helicase RepA family protein [Photobacterium damselae]
MNSKEIVCENDSKNQQKQHDHDCNVDRTEADQWLSSNKKRTKASWSAAANGTYEKPEYLWTGFLKASVGGLIAAGGVGKSYLAMGIGAAIVTKPDLFPLITQADKTKKVVYLTAEDSLPILEERMECFCQELTPNELKIVEKQFEVHSIQGWTPELLTKDGLRNEKWINAIKRMAESNDLLMIDTLRKFHKANENDSGDMTHLTQILDEIATTTGCAILFLHHQSKSGTGTSDQTASRGSSSLVDNIRYQLSLSRMSESEGEKYGVAESLVNNFVRVDVSKSNYGKPIAPFFMRRLEGGVLKKAVLDTPVQVKKAKERKEEKQKVKSIDPSNPRSTSQINSYNQIFGGSNE